ncbi:MAG: hypothetical protein GEU76_00205 [Alphaproteobacteria bacterium]|nr:hypothetical protein [Alphaproteobacteria bacterium]
MKIVEFVGKGIHGYINVRVRFLDDLTFLIGINGSGKTTVVRTIHALLSMNLTVLAYTDYAEVVLKVRHEGKLVAIKSWQDQKGHYFSVQGVADDLFIPRFEMPPTEPQYKFHDLFYAYYQTQISISADHPVCAALKSLPTPMYLGIERRSEIVNDGATRLPRRFRGGPRRNIFAGSLADSLDEASDLAATAYLHFQQTDDKLKEQLRNALLLRNFEFLDVMGSPVDIPTVSRNVMMFVEGRHNKRALSSKKISKHTKAVESEILKHVSRSQLTKFEKRIRKKLPSNVAERIRFISGKNYLLPLLMLRLKQIANLRDAEGAMKVRLARHADFGVDSGLERRLKKLIAIRT